MNSQLQILPIWALLIFTALIAAAGVLAVIAIIRSGILNRRANDCGSCEREHKGASHTLTNAHKSLIDEMHSLIDEINERDKTIVQLLAENRTWKRESEAKSMVLRGLRDFMASRPGYTVAVEYLDELETDAGVRNQEPHT